MFKVAVYALAMGVGLAAKKIALATNENAKRYHSISQKYLSFLDHDENVKLGLLRRELESKNEFLEKSSKKLIDLENETISESDDNFYKNWMEYQKEATKKNIELLPFQIESLEKEIKLSNINLNPARKELNDLVKKYLLGKIEQFDSLEIEEKLAEEVDKEKISLWDKRPH